MKYRKRPVEIDAVQYTKDNKEETLELIGEHLITDDRFEQIHFKTLEGNITTLRPGDYLIRGVLGEVYPCDPEVFRRTYEASAPMVENPKPIDS